MIKKTTNDISKESVTIFIYYISCKLQFTSCNKYFRAHDFNYFFIDSANLFPILYPCVLVDLVDDFSSTAEFI